jgi:putative spermidine/putrescine transport system permease protein
VLLFLVAPIVAIVPLSFSAGSFLHYPLPGLSLRWYRDFFASEFWLPTVWNSALIGGASAALATVIGTLAAIGLWRARFPGRGLVFGVVMFPMMAPVVIVAVAVYFAYAQAGLANTYLGIILAHTALGAPFVVVTVYATLAGFDPALARAAASLGASPVTAFRRVTLPLILPGVVSGALFALVTSLDEVVVVLFMAAPEQRTLPRQMFAGINDNISLTITAAATLLVVLAVALMLTVAWLRRRGERLRGG